MRGRGERGERGGEGEGEREREGKEEIEGAIRYILTHVRQRMNGL